MGILATCIVRVNIYIINFPTSSTLILIVNLHDFDLLVTVYDQFLLVFQHQVLTNAQTAHLLCRFHFYHHVVQNKERLAFDCLKCLEDIAVLLSVEVEGVFGVKFTLQLLD